MTGFGRLPGLVSLSSELDASGRRGRPDPDESRRTAARWSGVRLEPSGSARTGNGRRAKGRTGVRRNRADAEDEGSNRSRRYFEMAEAVLMRTPRGRGESRTPSGFLAFESFQPRGPEIRRGPCVLASSLPLAGGGDAAERMLGRRGGLGGQQAPMSSAECLGSRVSGLGSGRRRLLLAVLLRAPRFLFSTPRFCQG